MVHRQRGAAKSVSQFAHILRLHHKLSRKHSLDRESQVLAPGRPLGLSDQAYRSSIQVTRIQVGKSRDDLRESAVPIERWGDSVIQAGSGNSSGPTIVRNAFSLDIIRV